MTGITNIVKIACLLCLVFLLGVTAVAIADDPCPYEVVDGGTCLACAPNPDCESWESDDVQCKANPTAWENIKGSFLYKQAPGSYTFTYESKNAICCKQWKCYWDPTDKWCYTDVDAGYKAKSAPTREQLGCNFLPGAGGSEDLPVGDKK